jgi:hypothetical protein
MRTERVTYLTDAEQKAALQAFAKARGESVGSIVREATARYISQPADVDDEQAALALLLEELTASIPKWNARFDSMEAALDHAHDEVRKALAEIEAVR